MAGTTSPRHRILAAAAKFVIASGVVAAGATALSPFAQADAQFDAFKESCLTNPGAYAAGAVRGSYRLEVVPGKEMDQICSLYGAAGFHPNGNWLGDYTRQTFIQNPIGAPHPLAVIH
ncbi:hypothetical protein [Mycobacterium sp. HM-7]